METQQELNYQRVASAISFFRDNYKSQPKLEDVAEHVHLSPFHFQRMFQEFAGVTPKQFLQYISVEHNAGYGGASRAVGTAVGKNSIAFLIPCHRVIKVTGEIGQYHWGAVRKNAIIGWEAGLLANQGLGN